MGVAPATALLRSRLRIGIHFYVVVFARFTVHRVPPSSRYGAPGFEGIPETADRVNEDGAGGVLFHFLTQAQDTDDPGAVGDGAVLSPDRVQQLFAAEDYAGAAHQVLQQAELGGRQGDRFAVETYLAHAAVQFQPAAFQHTGGRGLVAELELDARDQLTHEERRHRSEEHTSELQALR